MPETNYRLASVSNIKSETKKIYQEHIIVAAIYKISYHIMTSSHILIASILFLVLLVKLFHQRDEILTGLMTSEKDNYQAAMNTFRQKGKFALLN